MYNNCQIYVNNFTYEIGINLKDLLKYLQIKSTIHNINFNYNNHFHQDDFIFLIYNNQYLDNLVLLEKKNIYLLIIDEEADKKEINYKNLITINKNSNNFYDIPCLPKKDDDVTNNIINFEIINKFSKLLKKQINFDIIHHFSNKYNFTNIKNILNVLKNNSKNRHRYVCYYNLNLIKHIQIRENFGLDKTKETLLIEFRQFPHLEFLVRNTIIKLSKEWNHTIVCGKDNYSMIYQFCRSIDKNLNSKIKIINLPINNLNRDDYCRLLTNIHFWNLIKGKHILLYQEDTCLFHGNIDPFLKYDYVGAPWKLTQDDNSFHVGNGGFSLRNKDCMIKVLKQNKTIKLGNSTKKYMIDSKLKCIPEDVYFSKSIIDHKQGSVANYNTALNFSQESILSKNPLGGHAFWISEPNKKIFNVYKLYDSEYYLSVTHRGGWKHIVSNLIENNIINNKDDPINNNILFLDIVEKYFLWEKNRNVINKDWVGIIHIVPNTPSYHQNIRIENLLNNETFLKSLSTCRGLIVLSKYLLNYLSDKINNVNLKFIKHPIVNIEYAKFNMDNIKNNDNLKIIQLGSQLRYLSTIFKLKTSYKKIWLPGRKDNNLLMKWLYKESLTYNIHLDDEEIRNVEIFYTNNFKEYDYIVSNNIIIIHLINSSANNAVLELMNLNIPFFVNKLPAVVEYLGNEYPLYFDSIQNLEKIINNKELLIHNLSTATLYLKNINKQDISIEYFNSELLKFINC